MTLGSEHSVLITQRKQRAPLFTLWLGLQTCHVNIIIIYSPRHNQCKCNNSNSMMLTFPVMLRVNSKAKSSQSSTATVKGISATLCYYHLLILLNM